MRSKTAMKGSTTPRQRHIQNKALHDSDSSEEGGFAIKLPDIPHQLHSRKFIYEFPDIMSADSDNAISPQAPAFSDSSIYFNSEEESSDSTDPFEITSSCSTLPFEDVPSTSENSGRVSLNTSLNAEKIFGHKPRSKTKEKINIKFKRRNLQKVKEVNFPVRKSSGTSTDVTSKSRSRSIGRSYLKDINLNQLERAGLLNSPYLTSFKNAILKSEQSRGSALEEGKSNEEGENKRRPTSSRPSSAILLKTDYNSVRRAILSAGIRSENSSVLRNKSTILHQRPTLDELMESYKNYVRHTSRPDSGVSKRESPTTIKAKSIYCPNLGYKLLKSESSNKNHSCINANETCQQSPDVPSDIIRKPDINSPDSFSKHVGAKDSYHKYPRVVGANTNFGEASKSQAGNLSSKLETLRTMCQRSAPTRNYWSKDISNYYEWSSFCLLRKYRKDAEKIKQQIQRLDKDRLALRHMWSQAEAYNNYIQEVKLGGGKRHELFQLSKVNLNRVLRGNSVRGSLVPPPKAPELSFLAPKLISEIDFASSDQQSSQNQNEPEDDRVQSSVLPHSTVLNEEKTKEAQRTWDKSDTLEIVTSYMPETKPKLKSKFTMRSERPTLDSLTLAQMI